jgi:hypothetical protein
MSDSTEPRRTPLHPYLVLLIAAVAPGSGHWAAGNIQRGVMFAWFMIVLGWITWRITGPEVNPIGRLAGGLFVYTISILDAYRIARFRWARYHADRSSSRGA